MISANELRIGNLIKFRGARSVTVKGVHNNSIFLNGEDVRLTDKNADPIELTEEWLLKFGFEILSDTIFDGQKIFKFPHSHSVIYLHPQESGTFIIGTPDFNSGYLNTAGINYVHQLQNLYFALTKKELLLAKVKEC